MKTIKVAVAGNPNSGKSTLINAIAGTHLYVGNWPGVTVEKKTATFKIDDLEVNLVDLPGTYSLSPYTQEEVIARDFLVKERPDVIVDVVDSTNLERNLYFTVQLLELGIPVVVALNIYDEAKKKGYEINTNAMEQLLGIKVVPTVATKKEGVNELLQALKEIAAAPDKFKPAKLNYGEEVENSLKIIEEAIQSRKELTDTYPIRWLSLKLLEGDERIFKEIGFRADEEFLQRAKSHFLEFHEQDIESMLTEIRYGIAHGVTEKVLKKKNGRRVDITERIDKVVLNRYIGIPIFLAVMWFVFKFAFDFSSPFCDWIDGLISGPITHWAKLGLNALNSPEWLVSLVTEGVIAGVGAVLVFVPLIGIVMFLMTLLEGSGYMARAAFVMDKLMHSIGLHGKSFIPLILGFGCNVPSIYATRVLETQRDRKLTAMICPPFSCSARLPVYVLFIGAFFTANGATVLWSLYILGVVIAIVTGFLLKNTILKGPIPPFIMELPPYRIPTLRDLKIHTWQKLRHFLIKAGTFIFASSIVFWFLLNTPYGVEKEKSYLGKIGKAVSPVFEPLGFGNWQATSALITGVIAKEVVVSTMAQIYAPESEEKKEEPTFSEEIRDIFIGFISAVEDAFYNVFSSFGIKSWETEEQPGKLQEKLQTVFSPLSAYAFLVFVLLYLPCLTFAFTLRAEFGWKTLGQTLVIYLILPWITAFIVYQGGKLLGF
ncbi:ferrous iron transport protein B [Thermodesulfovibrio sp. 3907-1M]|uniref:Ferrous iron transport protein B n=1 Tax=Thermodesulfovibrio autotrophicus TaxID=3118333 RepID=A0AAU8GY73_9BACT